MANQDAASPLPVQNEISHWAGNTSLKWQNETKNGATKLFNDPDKVGELINDGKFLNTGFNESSPLYEVDYYKRTMFAAAVHSVWMTGENREFSGMLCTATTAQAIYVLRYKLQQTIQKLWGFADHFMQRLGP